MIIHHTTAQNITTDVSICPPAVAPVFLLARFVWTLILRLKNFCETGIPRLVRVTEKQPTMGEYQGR